MTAIWLLNLFGHDWEDSGQLFFTGLIVGVLVIVGAAGLYSFQSKLAAQNQTFAGRLVQHFRSTNTKMYGAFWCPHCRDQKVLFGDAAKQIPYVECDPRGENPQPKLCQDKQIKSFPTWEFNNQLYEGQKTLDQLADLTGYKGARN